MRPSSRIHRLVFPADLHVVVAVTTLVDAHASSALYLYSVVEGRGGGRSVPLQCGWRGCVCLMPPRRCFRRVFFACLPGAERWPCLGRNRVGEAACCAPRCATPLRDRSGGVLQTAWIFQGVGKRPPCATVADSHAVPAGRYVVTFIQKRAFKCFSYHPCHSKNTSNFSWNYP